MFQGFFELAATAKLFFQARTTGDVPVDADELPKYRVYGVSGVVFSGTCAFADSGTPIGATNASPIVITSTAHGLTTGTLVTLSGVGGNTNANGTFAVTRINANTFSLDGTTGNGVYTSGGEWHATGFYAASFTASEANGFAAEGNYTAAADFEISNSSRRELVSFCVN